jgi:hypothetical protein
VAGPHVNADDDEEEAAAADSKYRLNRALN